MVCHTAAASSRPDCSDGWWLEKKLFNNIITSKQPSEQSALLLFWPLLLLQVMVIDGGVILSHCYCFHPCCCCCCLEVVMILSGCCCCVHDHCCRCCCCGDGVCNMLYNTLHTCSLTVSQVPYTSQNLLGQSWPLKKPASMREDTISNNIFNIKFILQFAAVPFLLHAVAKRY